MGKQLTNEEFQSRLSAMNIDENYKLRVIRLSTSDYTTLDECKYLIDKIKEMIEEYKI